VLLQHASALADGQADARAMALPRAGRSLTCFGRLLIPDRNGNNRHSAVHRLARALILCLDSELPDGGVSVVRSYAELSQPIIDPFVHFGRLASGEGFHLSSRRPLRIARYYPLQ